MLIKERSAKPQKRLAAEIVPNSDPVGLEWLLRTLWRRKLPIILATVLLSLFAALVVARIPPFTRAAPRY